MEGNTGAAPQAPSLGDAPTVGDREQLQRLVQLRHLLAEERSAASTPAVARALEMADQDVFLALGYFGYSDFLFPEEQ